jgi:hypothetical protein
VETLDFLLKQSEMIFDMCDTLISAFPGTSFPCAQVGFVVNTILNLAKYNVIVSLQGAEGTHDDLVNGQNDNFELQRQEVTLFNVGILHDNVISLFSLAQQLKLILGGVMEALPSDNGEDDETRRRLAVDCEDAIDGACINYNKVSCKDPKYLCNGFSINWNFVAFLKFGENSTVSLLCFLIYPSVLY